MATRLIFIGGLHVDLADDVDRVMELAIRSHPKPVALEGADGSRVMVNWDHVLYALEEGAPGTQAAPEP